MTINSTILETLLHQSEGSALDFKQEQYEFASADIGKKAELLKDIMAFANAPRLTTGYILIGVKEVTGGRNVVVGVQRHLSDAALHQFVNHKTQRPVEFTYFSFPAEGTEIGVLEIPIQERPIFLTRRFGPLDPNAVYIRDGSSTRIANPDEIARIGAEQTPGGVPKFDFKFADAVKHVTLPSPPTVHSLNLDPRLPDQTFSQRRSRGLGSDPFYNRDYSPGIIACVAERALVTRIGFHLRNESRVVGQRIRFVGRIAKSNGLVLQETVKEIPPRTTTAFLTRIPELNIDRVGSADLALTEYDKWWEIDIDFGDVRPRDEVWIADPLFMGSANPGIAKLAGELKGDNLPDPAKYELMIRFEVERRPMELEDVRPFMNR